MDLLCHTIMVEEILPLLHPITLLHLAAASRRYNALVREPGFAARCWQRAGIFFQRNSWPAARRPLFLTRDYDDDDWPEPETEPMLGEDLAFLPGPSAREKAYMRSVGSPASAGSVVSIMHSAAGLLLCSRGITLPRHFYVCNPVTCQWVALPELPWHPREWRRCCGQQSQTIPGGPLQPSYALGEARRVYRSELVFLRHRPVEAEDKAVAYNSVSHSVHFIPLPRCIANTKMNRIIGERHGGGLRYAHGNSSVFEVWDSQTNRDGNIMWTLVYRIGVSVTELLEWNPEAAGCLLESPFIEPVGFHPTDDDVVFLGMPGAVAAYSMEYGTISIQCTHDSSVAYDYPNGAVKPIGLHPTDEDVVFFSMPKAIFAYSMENGTMSSQFTHASVGYSAYPDADVQPRMLQIARALANEFNGVKVQVARQGWRAREPLAMVGVTSVIDIVSLDLPSEQPRSTVGGVVGGGAKQSRDTWGRVAGGGTEQPRGTASWVAAGG
ncbi:hypothetical protein EJB05_16025, partial [Eragrostis curvula]